mgnify:CR=1 FL=1
MNNPANHLRFSNSLLELARLYLYRREGRSRFKATAAAGSITLGYDHDLDSEGNVKAAVKALVKKLAWDCADTWHRRLHLIREDPCDRPKWTR